MKKIIILFLVFSLAAFDIAVFAGDYSTDFKNAFKIGDSEGKAATFKYIGVETTLSVSQLKEQFKSLGYGSYFAADQPSAGYTENVDRAFKAYAEAYEGKLKTAEQELNKNPNAN